MADRRCVVLTVWLVAVLCAGNGVCRGQEPGAGSVQFSDGTSFEGTVRLTPGHDLKLHGRGGLSSIPSERVREIRLRPVKESMERKWRFLEAGQTRKKEWGEPYPVRFLDASVILTDGEVVEGHLYTTVFYLEGEEQTRKVVLHYKQRGKEGETFDDLVFPVRIDFGRPAEGIVSDVALRVTADAPVSGVTALTRGALVRLPGRRGSAEREWRLPADYGVGVFLGVHTESGIVVGWPEGDASGEAEATVAAALEQTRDFFDGRELLGVYRDPDSQDIYSLVMLRRVGKTTYGAERNRPWRLGVWRWHEGEPGRVMFAARGYLFRGILAADEAPPPVRLSPGVWRSPFRDGATVEARGTGD